MIEPIHGKAPLLHVGYPKALSSWMQNLLFKPEMGFCKILDSLTLQLFLIDPPPFSFTVDKCEEWVDKVIHETEGSEHLYPVITGEALVGHTHCGGYNAKVNADRLFELCPDARVLIVIREQKTEIRSLYKTFVIWGMPHSIGRILEPVDPNLSPQFNFDFLRYDQLVGYYQTLYGKDNVLVLPYEQFGENPEEFVRSIYAHTGQEVSEQMMVRLPFNRLMNSNQTLTNLILQRFYNMFFLSNPFNYAGIFVSNEDRLHKRISRSKRNPFPAFMDNWFEKGFASKVEVACRGQFVESNRRLQEITGLDLGRYGYDLGE
jgi:hypothetical protein